MMDIGVYDFETYGLGGDIAGIGAYDGKTFYQLDDIDALLDFFERSPINIWYAHNGGKYDIKYLLKRMLERYVCDFLDIHGNYGCVKAYRSRRSRRRKNKRTGEYRDYAELVEFLFELRDSILLLPASLSKLSIAFDIEHKKQEYEDYINHEDKEKMYEYLKYDCMALYEILDSFARESGLDSLKLTTASTAMYAYRKQFDGDDYLKMTGRYNERYREGYYGGRTEVFKRYGEDLYYYDVNSLYPSVMYGHDYPFGPVYGTYTFRKGKLGYYYCTVGVPADLLIPLLPYRQDGKLMFPSGTFTGWYYSPEIEKAYELGYDIEIHHGYFWDDTYRPFDGYIDYYYDIKKNSTGAKRYIAKLMLNSLYGKFAQNAIMTKKYDLRNMPVDEIIAKKITPYPEHDDLGYGTEPMRYSEFIRPQIAGICTSYARVKLYDYMQELGLDSIYYCDTDSVISDNELTKGVGTELGEMKLECEIQKGIFLLPKLYSIITTDYDKHVKAKGLDSRRLCFNDFELALNGNFEYIKSYGLRVIGINEKLNRGLSGTFHETEYSERDTSGEFTKRIICEDGIHTIPLSL